MTTLQEVGRNSEAHLITALRRSAPRPKTNEQPPGRQPRPRSTDPVDAARTGIASRRLPEGGPPDTGADGAACLHHGGIDASAASHLLPADPLEHRQDLRVEVRRRAPVEVKWTPSELRTWTPSMSCSNWPLGQTMASRLTAVTFVGFSAATSSTRRL